MRRIVMVLLAIGAVAGFAMAFRHHSDFGRWHRHHGDCHHYGGCNDREAFERHIADVCVRAAQGASNAAAAPAQPAPAAPHTDTAEPAATPAGTPN